MKRFESIMEPGNCYQLLNCDENSSKEQVKSNYKQMALEVCFLSYCSCNQVETQMHPDKAAIQKARVPRSGEKSSIDKEDRFKMVTRAYKTLSDDDDRRKHDAILTCKTSHLYFPMLKSFFIDQRAEASIVHDEVDMSEFSMQKG